MTATHPTLRPGPNQNPRHFHCLLRAYWCEYAPIKQRLGLLVRC